MSVITHPLSIRIGQWIAGRHGPESGAVLLDRRRVYILPTKPGLLFGAAMLVLLIGSINYSLQLGYMLTFLVTSMAIVGMHTTHSNLAQIVLRGVRVEPVFAGDVAIFEITAANPTTVDRFALRFSFAEPTVSKHWLSVLRHRAEPMTAISTAVPARGAAAGTGARPPSGATHRHRDPLSVRSVARLGLPDAGAVRDGLSGAGGRRAGTAGNRTRRG